jgi:hypothetical protein
MAVAIQPSRIGAVETLPPPAHELAVAVSQRRYHRESLELAIPWSGAMSRQRDHYFVRSDIAKRMVRQLSSEDVLEAFASEEHIEAAQRAERTLETFDSRPLGILNDGRIRRLSEFRSGSES